MPILIWFILAAAMVVSVGVSHPTPTTYALCFLAWLGGIFTTLALKYERRA